MLEVNGKQFLTLNDPIYVNNKKVREVWANGVQVYPAYANYFNDFSNYSMIIPFKDDYIYFNEIDSSGGRFSYHCDTVFLYIKNSAGFDIQRVAAVKGEYPSYLGRNVDSFQIYVKSATGERAGSYPSVTYRFGGEGRLFIVGNGNDNPVPRGTFDYPEHALMIRVGTYSEGGMPYYIYRSQFSIALADHFYMFEPVSRMEAAFWIYEYFDGHFSSTIGGALMEIDEMIANRAGKFPKQGVSKLSATGHWTVPGDPYSYEYSNSGYLVVGDPCGLFPKDGPQGRVLCDALDFDGMYSNGIEVFRSEADAIAYLRS